MAYTAGNLSLYADLIGASASNQRRLWIYHSTDAFSTVDDTDYFTLANKTHGMIEGDLVFVFDTDSDPPDATIAYCSVVDSDKNCTVAAVIQGTTPSVTSVVAASLTVSTSAMLGDAAADLIGFYGKAGASQRASSVQATSNVASSTDFAAGQLAVLHEIMTTLTNFGLWKGTA